MLAALAPRAQGLPTKKGGAASDEIVAAAAKWGDAAIPLCSGDPDLPTPLHVSAAVIDALQRDESEKTIHYESGPGMLALRESPESLPVGAHVPVRVAALSMGWSLTPC